MACEDQRPCSRCVTRGIGAKCLEDHAQSSSGDVVHSTASKPSGSGSGSGEGSAGIRQQALLSIATPSPVAQHQPPPPPQQQQQHQEQHQHQQHQQRHQQQQQHNNGLIDMHINNIFANFDQSTHEYPQVDVPIDWINFQHPDQQLGTVESYARLDASAALQDLQSGGGSHAKRPLITERLSDHPGSDAIKRPRPWNHILSATFDAEDSTIRPYQHAYGYARLERWTRSNVSGWSVKAGERIHTLLQEEIRPRLRARWQQLSDLQLVEEEQRFLALVDFIRNYVSEAIDVPIVVLRRTWEIVCANEAWAALCQMNVSCFDSGRLCLYQLLSEDLAVETFER